MEQIRIWRVAIDGDIEIFNDIDVALEYTKASLLDTRGVAAQMESGWMSERSYALLADEKDGAQ